MGKRLSRLTRERCLESDSSKKSGRARLARLQVRDLHRLRRAAELAVVGVLGDWMLYSEEMVGEMGIDLNVVFWRYKFKKVLILINQSFGGPSNSITTSNIPPQSAIRLFVVLS